MGRYTKKPDEIKIIAEGGKHLSEALQRTAALVRPGVTTAELNACADALIRKAGGIPSFIGYGPKKNPFPAALCVSVDDVVVHGIPSEEEVLLEGNIIGLDIGMEYKGLFTDMAITVPVGRVSMLAEKLIQTTERALAAAIKAARPGNRIGDIGYASQTVAEAEGFSVVRDLVGHGVGYAVHEDPNVPGYGKRGSGILLEPGMVIAIEPMICEGSYKIYFDDDGWAIRTVDGGMSAHFEHTIAITEYGSRILTQ